MMIKAAGQFVNFHKLFANFGNPGRGKLGKLDAGAFSQLFQRFGKIPIFHFLKESKNITCLTLISHRNPRQYPTTKPAKSLTGTATKSESNSATTLDEVPSAGIEPALSSSG